VAIVGHRPRITMTYNFLTNLLMFHSLMFDALEGHLISGLMPEVLHSVPVTNETTR